ncbi:MAG: glycosyltransferase [Pirellulales bacterium]
MSIVDLIDGSAKRILEIDGFGDGVVRMLKARGACEVFGAAMAMAFPSNAPEWYDGFSDCRCDVSALEEGGQFDAIVCHRLLESVRDPLACLRRIRSWLAPDGLVVGRVANHGRRANVQSLIAGNLTYGPLGALQSNQLRLYTRRELEKVAYRAWLDPELVQGVSHASGGMRCEVRGALPAMSSDAVADAFLFRLRPATMAAYPLTSIVIVTWNELHYTRQCVESIIEFTDEPYELIFVDNGSGDGTADYLQGIPDARLIRNSTNRGFPAAVNQGIGVARGRQIVLLNNDCIVTTGWLRRMLDALSSDGRIGLVGPCTNYTAGRQCVGIGYDSLSDLDGFAWQRAQLHASLRLECSPLCGFCLLIRRTVLETIGGLDERFGLGTCDDDDFCVRAERAGYRLVAACDAYVHHFGSKTFLGAGIDVSALYERNKRLLIEKIEQEAKINLRRGYVPPPIHDDC